MTNAQKQAEWDAITSTINNMGAQRRTVTEVKKKWSDTKVNWVLGYPLENVCQSLTVRCIVFPLCVSCAISNHHLIPFGRWLPNAASWHTARPRQPPAADHHHRTSTPLMRGW